MKILLAEETHTIRQAELDAIAPEAEWVTIDADGGTDGDPEGCDVIFWGAGIFGNRGRLRTVLHRWDDPALRWLQGPAR